MASTIAAALGLALATLLAVLIGWNLLINWRDGALPNRNGTTLRRANRPKSFAFWFGFEALSFFGLVAVAAWSGWRLLTLLLAGPTSG